eukprot:2105937-Ditylum_brightwellii.AAC.1
MGVPVTDQDPPNESEPPTYSPNKNEQPTESTQPAEIQDYDTRKETHITGVTTGKTNTDNNEPINEEMTAANNASVKENETADESIRRISEAFKNVEQNLQGEIRSIRKATRT